MKRNCVVSQVPNSKQICFQFADDAVVTIPDGKIKGRYVISARQKKVNFYSYEEIPYGKAPVGSLRFRVRKSIYLMAMILI